MSPGAKPPPGQSTRRRWLLAAAIIVTAVTIVSRPGRDLTSGVVTPMAQFGTSTQVPASISPPSSAARAGPSYDQLDVSGLKLINDPAALVTMPSRVARRGYAPPARSSVVWSNKAGTITNNGRVAQHCCAGAFSIVVANKAIGSGRHYWELTLQAAPGEPHPDTYTSPGVAVATGSTLEHGFFRTRIGSASPTDPNMLLTIGFGEGGQYRSGDIFMFALDADNRTVFQGVNGTWINGTPGIAGGESLGLAGDTYLPIARISASGRKPVGDSWVANFGNNNFRYPIPIGYGAYGTYTRSAQGGSASGSMSPGVPGDTYREAEVVVGARNVPLPDGRWLELARFQTKVASDEAVVLALVNGPAVSTLIAIRAGEFIANQNYAKYPGCQRQDLLHADVKKNEADGQQQCWWVNHSGSGWLAEPALAATVTAAGFRNLAVPETMLNVGIRSADRTGHSLTLYYVDPNNQGISTSASDWHSSPWHSRNLASDRSRSDYVDELIDWGRNWAPLVYAYR